MTTRVHIVNYGPDSVVVKTTNPATGVDQVPDEDVYPQNAVDRYVHDAQAISISEKKK